jgi:2-polyprenyl-3-methyl-5-hydroxy-6-metoxy-1,4-benzoquinol methylase/uncharacterized protein YbaR (Trm112 family)
MYEELLEVLAEPTTGARLDLRVTRARGERIEEGELTSQETGKSYPIVRGIPRFVPEANYTDSFGMQWNHWREVQLDSSTQARASMRRFDSETGWTSEDLEGKWLLDGGCGAGRFAEVAAARGARVVALDMSSAVEAAARTLERFPRSNVVQGSVLDPPVRKGSFDFAYCIGVAQHTPDPPRAVAQVTQSVRPGGRFALTIYARRPWSRLNGKYVVRPLTRRLPNETLLRVVEASMTVLYPLTSAIFPLPVVGRLARFVIPVANYVGTTELAPEQAYREAVLDTFDMLSPRYDSPMTWQEVQTVLRNVGAREWTFTKRVPIECRGVR